MLCVGAQWLIPAERQTWLRYEIGLWASVLQRTTLKAHRKRVNDDFELRLDTSFMRSDYPLKGTLVWDLCIGFQVRPRSYCSIAKNRSDQ